MLPKPAEAYELDDLVFSSTQQLQNDAAEGGPEVTSPRGRGGKSTRRGGAAGGKAVAPQRGGRKAAAAAAVPSVAEEDMEAEEGQQGVGEGELTAAAIGTDTQAVSTRWWLAVCVQVDEERCRLCTIVLCSTPHPPPQVANILTVDLPDDEPGHTPGPHADEDELDTPLAQRFAKSSAERGAAWASGGSSGGRPPAGAGAAAGGGGARSRLALVSGPQQQQQREEEEEAEEQIEEADSEEEAMQLDVPGAAAQQEPEEQPHQEQEQQPAAAGQQQQDRIMGKGVAARVVAERFSVRQLVQHPERPVVLHKGTPLPGSLPSSPVEEK